MSTPARGSARPRRGRGGITSAVSHASPSARDNEGKLPVLAQYFVEAIADSLNRSPDHQVEETDEVRSLRSKYSSQLSTAKELFPDWTDEDILFALQEANGDVEVAIVRMSEGTALSRYSDFGALHAN